MMQWLSDVLTTGLIPGPWSLSNGMELVTGQAWVSVASF